MRNAGASARRSARGPAAAGLTDEPQERSPFTMPANHGLSRPTLSRAPPNPGMMDIAMKHLPSLTFAVVAAIRPERAFSQA